MPRILYLLFFEKEQRKDGLWSDGNTDVCRLGFKDT